MIATGEQTMMPFSSSSIGAVPEKKWVPGF